MIYLRDKTEKISLILLILIFGLFIPPSFGQSSNSARLSSTGIVVVNNPENNDPEIPPTSTSNELRIEGTKLVTLEGNEVILKGIQIHWNERMKKQGTQNMASVGETTWFSPSDLDRIKNNGGNLVEIHQVRLDEVYRNGKINEAYFDDWLDKWVNWCENKRIYYIINLKGLSNPDYTNTYLYMPYWMYEDAGYTRPDTYEEQATIVHAFYDSSKSNMDLNRQRFLEIWRYIANRYKDHEYVIFGLINEPLHFTYKNLSYSEAQYYGQEYSKLMTLAIDEIRSTRAKQPIFVDLPCLYVGDQLDHVFKINREGIVWEAHRYFSKWTPEISDYENYIDGYVHKIVNEFGQPLFIGEYSINPPEKFHQVSDWRSILSQMVSKIDERQIVGRDFHKNELLEGEYHDYLYNYFTSSESDDIIKIIFN